MLDTNDIRINNDILKLTTRLHIFSQKILLKQVQTLPEKKQKQDTKIDPTLTLIR